MFRIEIKTDQGDIAIDMEHVRGLEARNEDLEKMRKTIKALLFSGQSDRTVIDSIFDVINERTLDSDYDKQKTAVGCTE